MSSRNRQISPRPEVSVGGCPASASGRGRKIPFGRPVVPEEYSIARPSCSSAIGSEG